MFEKSIHTFVCTDQRIGYYSKVYPTASPMAEILRPEVDMYLCNSVQR